MPALRLIALLFLFLAGAAAAAPPSTATSSSLALTALEGELKAAESAPAPDTALLDKVRARLEAIRHEQARLQQAEERVMAAKQLERNGNDELMRVLAKARDNFPMPVLAGLSAERLTALLQQAAADEQAAQERMEAANRALTETELRGQALRQASLQPPPPLPPPAAQGEPPLLARASQLLAQIRQQAMEAESKALALEQSTQPLALQLAQARQLLAQHELEQLRKRRERIETTLNEQRLAEAEAARQSAGQSAVSESHPALKRLAEANHEWANRLAETTRELSDITRQRDETTRRTEAMRQDMSTLRQRLDQLGLGPVIGNLLLEKRSSLPTEAALARRIKDNRALVNDIQLLDLDVANARAALSAPQTLISQLLIDVPAEEQAALEPTIQRMIREREDILQRLDAIKPPLLLAINDLEFALESQRRVVREFSDFIAQNLLWMPNARPLWSTAWADYEKSLLTLFDLRRAWGDLRDAIRGLSAQPVTNLATVALILALLALRPQLRRRIRLLADRTIEQPGSTAQERIGMGSAGAGPQGGGQGWPASETLWTTLGAITLVFLYALPWPLLALLLGLRLQTGAPPGGFAQGIGQALAMLAPLLLYARAALALFHPNGLAERHFGWSPQTLHALRQAMRLFIFGVLPFAFLAAVAIAMDTEAMRDGAGRLAFMLALFGLALMFGRLLHPRGGVMLYWRMTHARHWSARLAPLWFALGIGLPILFAALAAVGYFYSAGVLTQKLVTSLWVALGLVVVYDFGLRALRLVKHRLQLQREQAPPPQIKTGGEGDGLLVPSNGMDVEQISRQSRKLLNFSLTIALLFALYAVWAPILPALGIFEQIVLWSYRGEIKGETVTVSVSLGDLLLSGLWLLAMWVAARNLPGLMEIILERWTQQDAGTRYAVITITRYIIIAVGLMLILGGLGLQWSQMQWLVAALGVGLGFGLQEIFANFVSGLIILFERPVRVGDMVSIGDKTGHIKKIHIRATVLEDFDRKEIIIPNKKLITEQVTNWTLSDTSTRVVVDVGVAYGSDPREVEQILREAASRVPGLIQDPPPGVWFMGFGDSALNFRLRAFVADAEQRTDTISELHYAIEYALREKGISIPFPQRDIHIRDIQGLPAGLFQENKAT
ncbi:mechanosensitive ion channel domain-containing protein [Thiofaba sp. EF100]|uniref:mechanosensitive ion channel domain-containing protein n=1 Tax=Thiofaba sp. EF100 TaxID=3121274 RepID=UPI0032217F79